MEFVFLLNYGKINCLKIMSLVDNYEYILLNVIYVYIRLKIKGLWVKYVFVIFYCKV